MSLVIADSTFWKLLSLIDFTKVLQYLLTCDCKLIACFLKKRKKGSNGMFIVALDFSRNEMGDGGGAVASPRSEISVVKVSFLLLERSC